MLRIFKTPTKFSFNLPTQTYRYRLQTEIHFFQFKNKIKYFHKKLRVDFIGYLVFDIHFVCDEEVKILIYIQEQIYYLLQDGERETS